MSLKITNIITGVQEKDKNMMLNMINIIMKMHPLNNAEVVRTLLIIRELIKPSRLTTKLIIMRVILIGSI